VTTRSIEAILIVFAAVFWLASAYWTVKDARRRIDDSWLLVLAALVGLVPYVGPLVYMLFRPPEYLEDVRERDLEIKAMEDRLSRRGLVCPVCRSEVESSFLVCPICTTKLRQACPTCRAPLEALWQMCPYCATPIDSTGTASIVRRRGS
jgi:hypothetical protein